MAIGDKLRLVHSTNRARSEGSDDYPAALEALPRVLIVTPNPDRYGDLPADIDFSPDGLEAVANVTSVRYDYVVVDVARNGGPELGCRLIRDLRRRTRVAAPIFLVMDDPLPSDRDHALASGATDVLARDRRALAAVFRGEPVRAAARAARSEPSWLGEVVDAMRLFLASEAEPCVREVYASLCSRTVDGTIEKQDVVKEASLLLEDLDDRRAFLRQAKVTR
jgi:CheY-like chemotaxis protein